MMRSSRLCGATALVAVVLAAPALAQPATAGSLTHDYEMNEARGASVVHDTGATRVDGQVGSEVTTGVWSSGAKGYRFPYLRPNTPPAHPQHLVTVPDGPSVDPGTSDYSIEIRYRTTHAFGNLLQKGQSQTAGGQVKIQLPKGRPTCYFKGSQGRVGTGAKAPIDDGQWHVIVCTRTAGAVDFYVDGVRVGHKNGVSGKIDNRFPLTIGGKPQCDQVKVTCDYFSGDVDYVRIQKG
jgi:hypothetical protein